MQYEMCMGKHPFTAQNEGALIRKILRGVYSPPTGYSGALTQLVQACLAFDQRRRPDAVALLRRPDVVAKARELSISLNEAKGRSAHGAATHPQEQLVPARHAAALQPQGVGSGSGCLEARLAGPVKAAEALARDLPLSHPFRAPAAGTTGPDPSAGPAAHPRQATASQRDGAAAVYESELAKPTHTAGVLAPRQSGQPFAADAGPGNTVRDHGRR